MLQQCYRRCDRTIVLKNKRATNVDLTTFVALLVSVTQLKSKKRFIYDSLYTGQKRPHNNTKYTIRSYNILLVERGTISR